MSYKVGDVVQLNPAGSYSEDYVAALGLRGVVVSITNDYTAWPYEVVFEGFDYKQWDYAQASHCCCEEELILVA